MKYAAIALVVIVGWAVISVRGSAKTYPDGASWSCSKRKQITHAARVFRVEKEGQIIVLRFAGTKIWELTYGGLNLWRSYDLIHQHRLPWIRLSDRAFSAGPDGEPLITSIGIKEIPREE
jgi:hypothetical protein